MDSTALGIIFSRTSSYQGIVCTQLALRFYVSGHILAAVDLLIYGIALPALWFGIFARSHDKIAIESSVAEQLFLPKARQLDTTP